MFEYRADPENTEEMSDKSLWLFRSIETTVLRRTVFFLESELYSVEIWMDMTGIYCKSQQKYRTESDTLIFSLGTSESETDERYLWDYQEWLDSWCPTPVLPNGDCVNLASRSTSRFFHDTNRTTHSRMIITTIIICTSSSESNWSSGICLSDWCIEPITTSGSFTKLG